MPCALILNVDEPFADGCMGATEFAPKIRRRYQTNELAVDSTEFGTQWKFIDSASLSCKNPPKNPPRLGPTLVPSFCRPGRKTMETAVVRQEVA
jgi:hypothetical protein